MTRIRMEKYCDVSDLQQSCCMEHLQKGVKTSILRTKAYLWRTLSDLSVLEDSGHWNRNEMYIVVNITSSPSTMSDDEEYEYDYGSDGEYDYGSDGGGDNEANEGGNDDLIDIENSFYGT